MATKEERNKRLDALAAATQAWADTQTAALQRRVAINKRILQGRTGSERLAHTAVSAASDLVISSIDDFLVTGS